MTATCSRGSLLLWWRKTSRSEKRPEKCSVRPMPGSRLMRGKWAKAICLQARWRCSWEKGSRRLSSWSGSFKGAKKRKIAIRISSISCKLRYPSKDNRLRKLLKLYKTEDQGSANFQVLLIYNLVSSMKMSQAISMNILSQYKGRWARWSHIMRL